MARLYRKTKKILRLSERAKLHREVQSYRRSIQTMFNQCARIQYRILETQQLMNNLNRQYQLQLRQLDLRCQQRQQQFYQQQQQFHQQQQQQIQGLQYQIQTVNDVVFQSAYFPQPR